MMAIHTVAAGGGSICRLDGAFASLMGRTSPLPLEDMQEFADFMLQVTYPPNPNRNRITSYNVCYTKLLRDRADPLRERLLAEKKAKTKDKN